MLDGLDLTHILPFIAVGFAAQIVDGALGMAFGIINNSLLLFLGVPPAAASASIHAVETFTTAASGISHVLHRNVDWRLFVRLVIPGMIGGAIGAYVLSSVDASVARPFVMAYLAAIGLYLLYRAWRGRIVPREPKIIEPLGLAGGFLDAAGGGGWGPVVTSNLLVQGASPRSTIGTVNTSEFFLTFTVSATFLFTLGLAAFTMQTLGILIGGVLAAPLGGMLAKRVPARLLMTLVGTLLTITSIYTIYTALHH
jgi:uncharacterized protein